jgi:hypothetical protein
LRLLVGTEGIGRVRLGDRNNPLKG